MHRVLLLTEDFTCGSNEIVCFGIFIYDSNQELTFNIKLSLPPGNKVKPSLMSFCKCYGARKQSAGAAPAFPFYSCLLFPVAYRTGRLKKEMFSSPPRSKEKKCRVLISLLTVIFYLYIFLLALNCLNIFNEALIRRV